MLNRFSTAARIPVWVILLMAAPRLLRLLAPEAWIEDEAYLNCALLLSRGELPYRDFVLQHFPLLEFVSAALFRFFGASVLIAEMLTQIAVVAESLLVFVLGRKLGGLFCGTVAAVVVALSPTLVRFHLYDREVFLMVPVLAALLLFYKTRDQRGRYIAVGLLLAAGMLIKLTAVAYFFAAIVFLTVVERRPRSALTVIAVVSAVVGGAAITLWFVFGRDFLVQVVVFAYSCPPFESWWTKWMQLWQGLGIHLVLAAVGLFAVVLNRQYRQWMVVLVFGGFSFLFVAVLKPIVWAHNGLELLPWLALLTGYLANIMAQWLQRVGGGKVQPAVCRGATLVASGLIVIFGNQLLAVHEPAVQRKIDRAEISALAAEVRAHSQPDDLVFVPSIVAFEARRREVVTNVEIAGWVRAIADASANRSILQLMAYAREWKKQPYFDVVDNSVVASMPRIEAAIKQRKVAVTFTSLPGENSPLSAIRISPGQLLAYGYTPGLSTEHYQLWLRAQ